jgi:hypothetical protein
MRIAHRAGRVAALLGGVLLSMALGMAFRAYVWDGPPDNLVGWSVWLAGLAAPALLSAALGRLVPRRSPG